MSAPLQPTPGGKRCVVLGADGYLGRHLVHYLRAAGHEVLACALAAGDAAAAPYRVADISVRASLEGIDWQVDQVFMFAGLTGTYDGFQRADQFVTVNEIGLWNVLEAIRASGARPRVVFPSTRLVYRGSDAALQEDDPCAPKTIYAVNKLACEHMLRAYSGSFDIEHTIYRICVPYGNEIGTAYSYGTVGAFLKQAAANGCIRLYGDGSLRRTFTHVEDVCRQILLSCQLDAARNATFNTGGEALSLGSVAAAIAAKYGATVEFSPWPEKDLRIESGHTVFDSRKLEAACALPPAHRMLPWLDRLAAAAAPG